MYGEGYNMQNKKLLISAALSLFISGCTTEESPRVFSIEKMFSKSPAIALGVSKVDVYNEASCGCDYENFFAQDVEKWARTRFIPTGSEGQGKIKVTEMKIVEHPAQIIGNLVTPSKDEYFATLTVRVSVNDAIGFEKSYVENTVKRSTYVPVNISLAERDYAIRKLITEVIVEMDGQVSNNINEHLSYNNP